MDNRHRIRTVLLVALLGTAGPGIVGAAEPAAEPGAEPVAAESETKTIPTREHPAVEAILATQPSTPRELVRAAKRLADLGRSDLSRDFLQRVLQSNLDQDQLVALGESLGEDLFTEFAARPDLAPEGPQLSEAVLSAVGRHVGDPQRLAQLVEQLQDPSIEARTAALVELNRAGTAAVAPLLAVLADPARAEEHENVRAALVELGANAVDPLVAALESGDPRLTREAIGVLAKIRTERSIPYLLAPMASEKSDPAVRDAAELALLRLTGKTPSKEQAARSLARRAELYFERKVPLRAGPEGNVEVWTWDAEAERPAAAMVTERRASLIFASRFARDAHAVLSDDPRMRTLHLATMLEQAAYANGLENPLEAAEGTPAGQVAACGPEIVEEVFEYALGERHAPAAAAAARLLGDVGEADKLLNQGAKPSPLVRATWDNDPRVRQAALDAILRLEPVEPFPGLSRVADGLEYFASSTGTPRALVAAPSTAEARRVGGFLIALGYEVETAVTGREAIRKLLASPDDELVFVDAALERPTVDFLLQQLRRDCRTATLPVGVTARDGQLERARLLARDDRLAEAFSRPHTQEAVQWQVERLLERAGPDRLSAAERQRRAAWAMNWLAELSGQQQPLFRPRHAADTAIAALVVPRLAPDALRVLRNVATSESQENLVDLASRWTRPLDLRVAAVEAFRYNTRQNGVLLTTDQILRQYDRYNQSENLDTGTQQVLGLILDCIEAPSRSGRQGSTAGKEEADVPKPPGNPQ